MLFYFLFIFVMFGLFIWIVASLPDRLQIQEPDRVVGNVIIINVDLKKSYRTESLKS